MVYLDGPLHDLDATPSLPIHMGMSPQWAWRGGGGWGSPSKLLVFHIIITDAIPRMKYHIGPGPYKFIGTR